MSTQQVTLAIGGMTCASCAARVEKRLNKLEGVTASVNYATEQAHVVAPGEVVPDHLIAEVEAAGYTARLPEPPGGGHASEHDEDTERSDGTRRVRSPRIRRCRIRSR